MGECKVIRSIAGCVWIASIEQVILDPTDPFQKGFVVGKP
ncbi:proline racemase family protein [Paenarthrobacter ureafaciens]